MTTRREGRWLGWLSKNIPCPAVFVLPPCPKVSQSYSPLVVGDEVSRSYIAVRHTAALGGPTDRHQRP